MILFKFGNLIRNIVGESISGECHFKLASASLLAPPTLTARVANSPGLTRKQQTPLANYSTYSQTTVGNMEGLKDPLD